MYFSIVRGEKIPPCLAIVKTRGTEGSGSVGDKKSVGSSRRLPRNWKSEQTQSNINILSFPKLERTTIPFQFHRSTDREFRRR